MRSNRFFIILWAALLIWAAMAPAACRADDVIETRIVNDAKIGEAYLRGEKPENVDLPCLVQAIEKLVAAIEAHDISYLKMIIGPDDQIVKDFMAAPAVLVRRDHIRQDNVIFKLKSGEPYFLLVMGKAMYTAGMVPEGFDPGKCAAD